MEFTVGQTVIHPHHGPAVVTGRTTRKVRGVPVDYLDLEVCDTGMTVCMPVSKAEEIGIRTVAGKSLLDALVNVLCGPSCEQESQWSRRMKAQRMEVATGDPVRIACVVRDLVRRREERGLSLAEKELLKEASAPLVAEIALAVAKPTDQARAVMLALVLEASPEVLERIDEVKPVAA